MYKLFLLLIGLVLISGCIKQPYSEAKGVIITTDKIEYELGETVNFTIYNQLNESIFLLECKPLGTEYWILYSLEETKIVGIWKTASGTPVCEERRFKEIKMESEESFSLNLGYSGNYRLGISIRLGCKESDFEDIKKKTGTGPYCKNETGAYSNEFTVKVIDTTIVTNKEQYDKGEEIVIKITNNMKENIGIMDVYRGVEKLENEQWVNLWSSTGYRCSCDPTCYGGAGGPIIEPHKSINFTWNQKMWTYCSPELSLNPDGSYNLKNSTFILATSGTYRIASKIGLSQLPMFENILYSNQFEIK